jgi:hypothetical protein
MEDLGFTERTRRIEAAAMEALQVSIPLEIGNATLFQY